MAKLQYKHYVLLLLTIVGVSNYLDRGVLALALEPIKNEFQLSDGQLGLLSGFTFALFYAVAGVPMARWADRGNRNHVITLAAAMWSSMLVATSVVGSFSQLLLARMGVAVGESGCVPPAQSLISDYFSRIERPRAMSIYWLCAPIATILSYIGGGWLIEQLGWRNTFLVIGLPGVLLAMVVKLTLREPRTVQQRTVAVTQVPLKDVLTTLWQGRAFRHLVMTLCISVFVSVGIATWIPAFFIRSYSMSIGEAGFWIGLSSGIGGLLFTYLGGYLATRYAPGKEALQMKSIALIYVCCGGVFFLFCLSDSKVEALVLKFVVFGVILPMTLGPFFAAVQSLVEERMRAVAVAFILMFSHLIGMGLGPVAIGVVSDLLVPSFGQESLRYSLLLFSPGYLWCAFHSWKSAATIEADIKAVEAKGASTSAQEATATSDITRSAVDNSPAVS